MTLGFSASAETVEYWDPVGKVTNSVEAVVVTGATTTLTGGWYVVTGEVSRAQINVTGTEARPANLILADGAKLTASDSSDYHPGIKVASDSALNIYAQSVDADTMGQISASGGYGGAGIGGAGEGGTCGTVNIYGGKLTAVGGEYAAGIGGGGKASKTGGTGGTISIYGGIVTANGKNGGAAIGGGSRADGGVISIYGGEVIADNTKGDSEGAGIGGGYAGAGGMILIAGGKVTAVGGYKDNGGAGIGGGEKGSGGTIMITGGIVNATGTDYGAGIGGGDEGAGGDVTISGGTVVAKAGKSSVWDIGSGSGGGFSGEFVVTGGSVLLANSGKCRDGYPKNGDGTQVYRVMIPDLEGKVTLEGLEGYGTNDIYTDVSGRICLYLPSGSFSFTLTDENGMYSVTVVDGQASVVPVRVRTSYWDTVSGVEKSEYCIVVDGSTVLKDGDWYVVTGKVARGSIAVSGNGNLILADGCELTANGGENQAGVAVPSGNSLTIYGQMAGTGKLTATGGDKGAGIGGGDKGAGGTVTVNGGTVTATGGWLGAGIGGGLEGDGGTVTVSGGRLSVMAGDLAAVIGAGYEGHLQGTVTILGGIFAWKPNDEWLVDQEVVPVVANPDAATCEKYPWAVDPTGASFVSFGKPLEHMTAAWTSGDGSVLKPIGREFFAVPKGATDVKVIFTPEERYELDKTEYAFAGPIAEDCSIPAEDMPTAIYRYVTVTVSQHKHVVASWTSGDGSVTNVITGASFEILKGEPFKVLFAPVHDIYVLEGPLVYESAGISADLALTDEQVPVARALPVEYVDADGSSKTCSDHDFVTDATSVLTSGWYAVAGEVSRGSIAVNGKVHLILLDGCELTAAGGDGQAGVFVDLGHSLTIYGQVNGTGKLIATGGENGAGIGGQNPDQLEGYGGFGAITVNGGVVSSTSGSYGAGIGGGTWGAGGEVTINGGTVTATVSYGYGAGIGGGTCADGGIVTVTINGGTVTATAVSSGAGIGGGDCGAGGVITISGGTVTATCLTAGGAGIGGGSNGGAGGKLTISGGIVTATGDGAGIGGGWKGAGGEVTISGGTVTATSTGSGAGIGGGNWGAGGTVTISGGRLKVVAGRGAAVIGAGNWGGSQGTVSISGGIFSWKPLNGWMADQSLKPWWNLDSTTCATYPWAVLPVWNVGEDVTAYVGDNMTLVIGGTGAMDDFASAADAPWNELAGEMTKVEVGDGVTHIGKNAFVGLADAVTVNGVQMSDYRMMGGAYGMSAGQSPSGFIEIVDGKAYLEVAVKTNVNLTAEAQDWGKVGLEAKDVSVENGSVIIAVPANDEQGFMVLESGAAK